MLRTDRLHALKLDNRLSRYRAVVFAGLAFLLAGCPPSGTMMLKNETDSELSVVYSADYVSRIAPGSTGKEIFNFVCVRLESAGEAHDFFVRWPPAEFIESRFLSARLYARFTEERQLFLQRPDDPNTVLELEPGCDRHPATDPSTP